MGNPLDAERERLRALGYTDEEITKILIAREVTPQQPTAGNAGQQQPLSGALGNVSGVLSHTRGVFPAIQSEVSTLRNGAAPAHRRALALGAILAILAVVGVLGYGASLELSVLRSQATKNAADARVAGEIAEAQAKKAKADACISRVESNAKNMRMSDVLNGTHHGQDLDECDPDYAEKKACADRWAAIFAPIDTFAFHDPRTTAFVNELGKKLLAFKADCDITDSDKQLALREQARLNTQVLGISAIAEEPQATPAPVAASEAAPVSAPPAEATPAPSPQAFRTPANFDCVNGKHMGADWVVCASPELLDMEAQLEDAYKAAHLARGDVVRHEQIQWIKDHGTDCGLPYRGRPASERIEGARDCIMANMRKRLAELQAEQ